MNKTLAIQKIIALCRKFGLFTQATATKRAIKRFEDEEGDIKVILTSGEPPGVRECSECRKTLPADQFGYYQSRVSQDGYMMRANALCRACREKLDNDRRGVLTAADKSGKIPPKPQEGSKCPNCGRAWTGNWHRDHDYKTGEFRRWICGQCNMAAQDRRTPNPKTE